ncbi:MAG: C40 family peptidase [Lapillicoccus sp.]
MRVNVDVTTLWVSPDSPRPVDAAALADTPDLPGWLRAMDARARDGQDGDGRLGLHGRVHTQLLAGEPVLVVSGAVADADAGSDAGSDAGWVDAAADAGSDAGWVEAVCPWQPSASDERGYRGWLRRAHLIPDDMPGHGDGPPDESWALTPDEAERPVLSLARRHLGLPYLWGGMTPLGLDCSGLVHLVWRELGAVVPRDADQQLAACRRLDVAQAEPGDLYFFAGPGGVAHHVGIVTAPGRMIHAQEAASGIVEEPLDDTRQATLIGAGRLSWGRGR